MGKKTIAAINKYPIKKGMRNDIVKYFQVAFNKLCKLMLPFLLVEDGICGEQTLLAISFMYGQNYQFQYQSDIWWCFLVL